MSMNEIKTKLDNKELLSIEEITKSILSNGLEKVKFIVPKNSTILGYGYLIVGNTTKNTICTLKKLSNKNDVELIPNDDNDSILEYGELYLSDIATLIKYHYIDICIHN